MVAWYLDSLVSGNLKWGEHLLGAMLGKCS